MYVIGRCDIVKGMPRSIPKPVQTLSDEQFLAISRAVSDPRRFAILQQVSATEEGIGCGALEEHKVLSPATVSHHVKELTDAGLLRAERDGRCSNLSMNRAVWKAYLARLSSV